MSAHLSENLRNVCSIAFARSDVFTQPRPKADLGCVTTTGKLRNKLDRLGGDDYVSTHSLTPLNPRAAIGGVRGAALEPMVTLSGKDAVKNDLTTANLAVGHGEARTRPDR